MPWLLPGAMKSTSIDVIGANKVVLISHPKFSPALPAQGSPPFKPFHKPLTRQIQLLKTFSPFSIYQDDMVLVTKKMQHQHLGVKLAANGDGYMIVISTNEVTNGTKQPLRR